MSNQRQHGYEAPTGNQEDGAGQECGARWRALLMNGVLLRPPGRAVGGGEQKAPRRSVSDPLGRPYHGAPVNWRERGIPGLGARSLGCKSASPHGGNKGENQQRESNREGLDDSRKGADIGEDRGREGVPQPRGSVPPASRFNKFPAALVGRGRRGCRGPPRHDRPRVSVPERSRQILFSRPCNAI